jgi:hypothetical protein
MTKRYYKCEKTHQTVNGVKLKRCTKCKRWKEESEFCKDRARKDGLKIYCKSCNNLYAFELRRKRKKPVREYLRYGDRHRVVRGFKEKLCSRCKQWKFYSDFYKNSRKKDGLTVWCIECENERLGHKRKGLRTNLRYEDRHRVVKGIRQKFCRKCNSWKNESEFYKNKSVRDGLNDRCKKCSYTVIRKTHKPKKKIAVRNLRYKKRHRVVNGVRQKYCSKCKTWKDESEFYKDRSKKDGLTHWCRKCSYIRSAT